MEQISLYFKLREHNTIFTSLLQKEMFEEDISYTVRLLETFVWFSSLSFTKHESYYNIITIIYFWFMNWVVAAAKN